MTRRLIGAIGSIGLVVALAALPAQASARGLFGTPQRVPGVGTSQYANGPSLADVNGRLYMAWPGSTDQPGPGIRIWWSSLSSGHWTAQQRITGVGTSWGRR